MCDNPARYRYTWPGNDESVICQDHVSKLRGVAEAMGLHLQIIPIPEEDFNEGITCNQKDS